MKVLIISHNPISTYNNMGKTLSSLFSSFEKEELCQLYIYPSVPDLDYCNSFFRITDKDVVKSILTCSRVKGKIIEPNLDQHCLFEDKGDESKYRNPKNKQAYRVMLRSFCWKVKDWFSDELRSWIDVEKPSHVFVAPGTGTFLYDIAVSIAQSYNLPIVTYICDDFYFTMKSNLLLDRIKDHMLKKKISYLLNNTKHLVTISYEAEKRYTEKWKIPASTIMTGASFTTPQDVNVKYDPHNIVYLGNVRCNRFISLIEIGEVLDEINEETGTKYELQIFSGEKDKDILATFQNADSIKFCGYVSGTELEQTIFSSDILLHTEAFDEKSIDRVKSSISTKIADLLSSGKAVFAYGPSGISSIEYLRENKCAVIADDKSILKEKLLEILSDYDLRKEISINCIKTSKKNHNAKNNSNKIRNIMEIV